MNGVGYSPPLTVAWGRPPAKERVVPILRVAAPVWEDVAVNLMVKGELTDLKIAIGNEDTEELSTV